MIKIAHLSSVHRYNDTRILYKECHTLAEAGYDVTFIVPHSHDETVRGVQIRALPIPANRAERALRTTPRVLRAALRENAVLYHFHDPELIPVGMMLKLSGKSVVYDVHEDVPKDILQKTYLPSMIRPALARIARGTESLSGNIFDGVATATPAIARHFPVGKTVVLQNFALLDDPKPKDLTRYSERGPAIGYVGIISELRGIREILASMSLISPKENTRLILAGTFWPPELENECRESPVWPQVDFAGWRSRNDIATILGKVRMGLVLFRPAPNHVEAQPNKLFEYMSAGLPIVASDFPLWRKLIETHRCGLVADPMDPRAIAHAIQWLLDNPRDAEEMGARGRAAVERLYCWAVEAPKLLNMYQGILSRRNERDA